jgi:hypothetical protein
VDEDSSRVLEASSYAHLRPATNYFLDVRCRAGESRSWMKQTLFERPSRGHKPDTCKMSCRGIVCTSRSVSASDAYSSVGQLRGDALVPSGVEHPGVSVEDAKSNTGFDLLIPSSLKTTEVPTDRELQILRKIDPARVVLRRGGGGGRMTNSSVRSESARGGFGPRHEPSIPKLLGSSEPSIPSRPRAISTICEPTTAM